MASDQGFEGIATPEGQAHAATSARPAGEPQRQRPVMVVQPSRGWIALRLRDLWAYRELAYFLVWRDVKIRYAQTVLGALWVVVQPLTMMAIFALVFARFAKLPSEGVPYTLFVLAALVPWTFFSSALTAGAQSLIQSERLVSKIYFPRLLLPIGAASSFLIDLVVSFGLLIVLMSAYGWFLDWRALSLVPIVLIPIASALAVGIFLAAVNVRYRDVSYAIPFLVQVWLFASPVAYSSTLIPARLEPFIGLNPMAGTIAGFRWALFGTGAAPVRALALSAAMCVVMLLVALVYFRQTERHFADVI